LEDAPQEVVERKLTALAAGDRQAAETLVPLLYSELRKLASSMLKRLRPGQTLQATALVHEAFLKLVRNDDLGWEGRNHFFCAAAQAMREILVDEARRKGARRHGAEWRRVTLDESAVTQGSSQVEVLDLHRALERLEQDDPRKGRVAILRCFAGLTTAEIAQLLRLSVPTIERDWRFARARLLSEMTERDARA